MSKGSSPRPFSVDQKTFDNNWDQIFGKKKQDHSNELPASQTEQNKEENEKCNG